MKYEITLEVSLNFCRIRFTMRPLNSSLKWPWNNSNRVCPGWLEQSLCLRWPTFSLISAKFHGLRLALSASTSDETSRTFSLDFSLWRFEFLRLLAASALFDSFSPLSPLVLPFFGLPSDVSALHCCFAFHILLCMFPLLCSGNEKKNLIKLLNFHYLCHSQSFVIVDDF